MPFLCAKQILLLAENSVLGGLGNAELENIAGFDFDFLLGKGIDTSAGGALGDDELSETGEEDSAFSLGTGVGNAKKLVISILGLDLGDLGGFGDRVEDACLSRGNFLRASASLLGGGSLGSGFLGSHINTPS